MARYKKTFKVVVKLVFSEEKIPVFDIHKNRKDILYKLHAYHCSNTAPTHVKIVNFKTVSQKHKEDITKSDQ